MCIRDRVFTRGPHIHRVVIGKDTRVSGYMLETALTSGFTSVGMDVFLFGPIPTPAVAFLTQALRADIGVMITASHNTYEDNGFKLFGPDGYKLSDEKELEIEKLMLSKDLLEFPRSEYIGRAKRIDDAQARYIEYAKRSFPKDKTLENIKIVLDCANGASYKVAPETFWELGAQVTVIGNQPNGKNINLGPLSEYEALVYLKNKLVDIFGYGSGQSIFCHVIIQKCHFLKGVCLSFLNNLSKSRILKICQKVRCIENS